MIDPAGIAEAYMALWNETDPERRRVAIAELFAEEAVHLTKSVEARGHAELEQRVMSSHQRWVRERGFEFNLLGKAEGHHDVVRLRWQMVPGAGAPAISVGSDVLLLTADGRIRVDYQFVDPV